MEPLVLPQTTEPIKKTRGRKPKAITTEEGNVNKNIVGKSEAERELYKLLTSMNITYTKEVRFDKCRGDKCPLSGDVLIIVDCKVAIIETDGRQHFERVPDFHKREGDFERGQEYDIIKNKFYRDEKISLLRIAYTDNKKMAFYVTGFIESLKKMKYGDYIHVWSSPDLYKDPYGKQPVAASGYNCIIM